MKKVYNLRHINFSSTFILSIALLFLSCEESLPRPTKKGKDTFGVKINGRNWLPETGLFGPDPTSARYGNSRLTVHAAKTNKNTNEYIYIYIENITKPGEYAINFNTLPPPLGTSYTNYGTYSHNDKMYQDPVTGQLGKYVYYTTNANHKGKVKITKLDIDKKIVAGTFEFTAEDYNNSNQTVKLTKGRFDLNFK